MMMAEIYMTNNWNGEVGPNNGDWWLGNYTDEYIVPAGEGMTFYMINMGNEEGTFEIDW